jgi:3-methyl-2-oxobutanoate hydroxymethyltransferase
MRQVPAANKPLATVHDFARFKAEHRKISMVTAYDSWSARLVADSDVDAILVGDSAAMVMHGHSTTVGATIGMLSLHTEAVAREANKKFVVADMPFLSYRKGIAAAVRAAGSLLRAGAHAVKLEGVAGHERVIRHIVESGIPVMGHVGLTPQFVHALGGYRVQGRDASDGERILAQAHRLEELGCFAVVLECVPASLAHHITTELAIPTIGIGAGPCTDGQVLVLHDLLGVGGEHTPRFVRRYADVGAIVGEALNRYNADVKGGAFPSTDESYA